MCFCIHNSAPNLRARVVLEREQDRIASAAIEIDGPRFQRDKNLLVALFVPLNDTAPMSVSVTVSQPLASMV